MVVHDALLILRLLASLSGKNSCPQVIIPLRRFLSATITFWKLERGIGHVAAIQDAGNSIGSSI